MKIKVKNLQQQTFDVEIDSEKTIRDLKQTIFEQQGEAYDPECQTLIYAGVIMQDDLQIKSFNIDEKKFLVCLVKRKPQKIDPPPKPENQPATTPTSDNPIPTQPEHTSNELLSMVGSIMELGYSEESVREALAISLNNPDRAVEYLSGNSLQSTSLPTSEGNQNSSENPLEFLRSQPQFRQMQDLLRQHPQLLNEVLIQISETNPGLMELIAQNQETFLNMLNGDEQEANEDAEDTIQIAISQEDKEAIDRLKALGFPEDMVVQAYFACEKDENLAANFLLSNSFEDD